MKNILIIAETFDSAPLSQTCLDRIVAVTPDQLNPTLFDGSFKHIVIDNTIPAPVVKKIISLIDSFGVYHYSVQQYREFIEPHADPPAHTCTAISKHACTKQNLSSCNIACLYPQVLDDMDIGIVAVASDGVCLLSNEHIRAIAGRHIDQCHVRDLFPDQLDTFPDNNAKSQLLTIHNESSGMDIPVLVEHIAVNQPCGLGWILIVSEHGNHNVQDPLAGLDDSVAASVEETEIDVLAHNLRTPLTLINESIAMIAEDASPPLNEMQSHFLSVAQKNVEKLMQTVNRVINYMYAQALCGMAHIVAADPHDIVHTVLTTIRELYPGFSGTLQANLDALSSINTDPQKLAYILFSVCEYWISAGNATALTITGATQHSTVTLNIIIRHGGTQCTGGHTDNESGESFEDIVEICRMILWFMNGSIVTNHSSASDRICIKIVLPQEHM